MLNEYERERIVMETPYTCFSCSTKSHVNYCEGKLVCCYRCAFSVGAVDEDQFREDSMEEAEILQEGNYDADVYI